MRFKDNVRFVLAKVLFRETVLFSKRADWEWPIRNKFKRYFPMFFYEFNEINPDLFDLVIPMTIHAQRYINEHHAYLKWRKALNPSNNAMDLCDNKEEFSNFLIINGFADFVPKTNEIFAYPYILKKKIGEWGLDLIVINDAECELAHINEIESGDYFRQEYIEGKDEYTTHIIINNKKISFYKTLKFTFAERFFIKGKHFKHISQEIVDHSQFKDLFEVILNTLEYQGICCFNYKLFKDKPKIFEINPRYGASMTTFINEALISYRDILKKSNRV
jgi:predicted ATP-grasp superfamily ATP-dependent carboligase